jgi:hypothetical protein
MFIIVKLLYGTQRRREGKEKRASTILKHNICAGRGYKNMY